MNDFPDLPAFLDRQQNGVTPMNKPAPVKPLVFTYTNLNTYENICPHQMFRRYIAKDLGPFIETAAMKWGTKVHEAFEYRISGGKPLPAEMNHWEHFATPFEGRGAKCEMKVSITAKAQPCDYFAKDVWLRGKIDVALVSGPTAFINDFKTGSSAYEDPFEVAVGALMLKCKMPELQKVVGAYTWLKENRQGQMHDLSDFRGTYVKVQTIAGKIEADRAAGKFEKRKSGLCGHCPVKDCENWYEAKK